MLTAPDTTGATVDIVFPTDDDDRPVVFTFTTRTLPGAEWERMLFEHRSPVDGFDYDPATFPPALIAASVTGYSRDDGTGPKSYAAPSLDDATELWSTWPQWARNRLLRPLEVQNVVGPALGKVSGRANAKRAATTVTG